MKRFMLICLLFLVALAIAGTASVAIIYNSQKLDAAKLTNYTKTLQIYGANDELIADTNEFKAVKIDELGEHTLWAFISTEDKNFYKHHGISWGRIAKAAMHNMSAGRAKEGASTISQQLIKNTHLGQEKTFKRKIREAVLAHKMEKRYTKRQILEMYFNAIYFGNGIYGLGAASLYYFNKPASELTLRESASLAALIKSPARYCPINNPQNCQNRTDLVLSLMHAQKKITEEQYNNAKSEPLTVAQKKRVRSIAHSYKNAASNQACKILDISSADLATLGFRVYTYYDNEIQKAVTEIAASDDFRVKTVSGKNADSLVIAASPDGHINALYATNPALPNARRNLASTLKPLVVYAPALEHGIVNAATIIADEPYISADFNPKNHDGKFHGNVTVRESIAHSYNIPAVKVLEYTRPERAADVARGLGLRLEDENLSLALGNTKSGTTFNELLGGYCTIAGGGIKRTPSYVRRIENRDGKTVYEHLQTETRVLGDDTCFLLTDMLRDAAKKGTAKKMESISFDIAAKTGTAERGESGTNTDAINISFTPENVVIVWNGNADMKTENDLPYGSTGGGITTFAARDIQRAINKNNAKFEMPESVEKIDGEYFSKRHKSKKTDVTKTVSITLDGRIGDTGAPMLFFKAVPTQTYEIYRGDAILEVIKNYDGEYIFVDSHAPKARHLEYFVKSNDQKSNTVKIYTAKEINRRAAPPPSKKPGSRHWFF